MARRRYAIVDGHRVLIVELDGFDGYIVRWTDSCSGCTETVDGYNSFGYPVHPKHGCLIGGGCSECGYTGLSRQAPWVPLDAGAYQAHVDAEWKKKEQEARNAA